MADWRPMTDLERRCALALSPSQVTYLVAPYPKRFARSLAGQAEASEPVITDKQAAYMWRQAWTLRRQVGDADVRREADRRHTLDLTPSPTHP